MSSTATQQTIMKHRTITSIDIAGPIKKRNRFSVNDEEEGDEKQNRKMPTAVLAEIPKSTFKYSSILATPLPFLPTYEIIPQIISKADLIFSAFFPGCNLSGDARFLRTETASLSSLTSSQNTNSTSPSRNLDGNDSDEYNIQTESGSNTDTGANNESRSNNESDTTNELEAMQESNTSNEKVHNEEIKSATQISASATDSKRSMIRVVSLSQENDKMMLSKFQSFLREHIEVFTASDEDEEHSRGRNNPITYGQVGIRCKYCSSLHAKDRTKGATYFPSTLCGIYQAAQNMNQYHFSGNCPRIPAECHAEFAKLQTSKSSCNGGKEYWSDSAQDLGLVETVYGLRFKDHINNEDSDEITKQIDSESLSLLKSVEQDNKNLVSAHERNLVTDYVFFLFSQLEPCDKGNTPSTRLPGLMCKHCKGAEGAGLFTPINSSSISKNKKFLQIEKHLSECRECPPTVSTTLTQLKEIHPFQMRKMKRGNKKEFFTKLIERIS